MALSIQELKQQALARQHEADLKVQREAVERQRAAATARAAREQAQRQSLERERQARIQAAARQRAQQAKIEQIKDSVKEDKDGSIAPPPRAAASQTAFHAAAAKLLDKKQAPSKVAKIRSATASRPGTSRPRVTAASTSTPRTPRAQPVYDKPDLTREEKRKLKLRRELMGGPTVPSVKRGRMVTKSEGVSALARATSAASSTARKPVRSPARPKGLSAPPQASTTRHKVNPADFLPGAPVRSDVLETARRKELATGPGNKRPRKDSDAPLPKKLRPEPVASHRKETPRERFIREEAERKAALAAKHDAGEQYGDDDSGHSEEDGHDDEDSAADSFIDDDEEQAQSELHEVLGMFRRGRQPVRYDEDDSDSDMEAGINDVNREELRSARLAREEDEREQALEFQHAEEKARRRKMLEKLKSRHR